MKTSIATFVGGPLDGETRRIGRCRKFLLHEGEKVHVYRPAGERRVWTYDLEWTVLHTIAKAAAAQRLDGNRAPAVGCARRDERRAT